MFLPALYSVCVHSVSGERQTETENDRDRDRETDPETDRQTETENDRPRDTGEANFMKSTCT